jgi:hypothetical protein
MTNPNEDLLLDADGIPILTDPVHKDEAPAFTEQALESHKEEMSAEELAGLLLNSDTFRQQLDEITAELTRTVRQQLESILRPTIEEAISLALDDSNTVSHQAVRKQLETALPDLLARTLQN